MHEKTVRVRGELASVWQTLLNTLAANRYQIESQVANTNVVAHMGSKVTSALSGTGEDGYRDLTVTMIPVGEEIEAQFRFSFPSWTPTMRSAKRSCDALVDDFARMTSVAPAAVAAASCADCGHPLREGAKFCDKCGAAVALPAVCAECGAALRSGAKFCANCGKAV
ncbi:MAG TPA: zinc ribbon domain-containing protein [Anaerolineae bacterium]|nr:zinc ribbon domain-containing protein [Anaerolineae bacterium]